MSASPRSDAAAVAGDGGDTNTAAESADAVRATVSTVPESATVGIVVFTMQDKPSETAATQYSPAPGASLRLSHGEARSFVAVLAPTASAAKEFLASQPPGAYVLVKEVDNSLAVWVKFRMAIRTAAVIKAKDWKKARGTIEWSVQPSEAGGVFAGFAPPVYRAHLAEDMFNHLEHCCERFLPHVQSFVFEMCCESTVDEKLGLDDCAEVLASTCTSAPLVILLQESCGFYLLNGPSGHREASPGVHALRQVDFDFSKFCMTVADGSFKPAALLMAVQLLSRRTLEPNLTFRSLSDNFQFPDRVKLKETAVSVGPMPSLDAPNYIELSSDDRETELLRAVCTASIGLHPLASTPFPDTLLSTTDAVYAYFASSYLDSRSEDAKSQGHQWPEPKVQLVSRVLPVWIELMVAVSVTTDAAGESSLPSGVIDTISSQQKTTNPISRLARALRFILVATVSRSDAATTSRLVFLIFRLFALRSKVPTELVALIRDMCEVSPTFRRLFSKSHGALLLWSATHSTSKPIFRKPVSSRESSGEGPTTMNNLKMSGLLKQRSTEHRASMFSSARKVLGQRNRSLFEAGAQTDAPNSEFYSFFRLDPHSLESELLKKLTRRQFSEPNLSKLEVERECCLSRRANVLYQEECSSRSCRTPISEDGQLCHIASEVPVKMVLFEVFLRLGTHLLLQDPTVECWDKSVAMFIRCEKLHESLAEEVDHTSLLLSKLHRSDGERGVLRRRRYVAVECISVLFELEKKRRRAMKTALGAKKYVLFIVRMQATLRESNERFVSNARELNGTHVLEAHAVTFRWIPTLMLEEWLMLSFGEIFETVAALNQALKRSKDSERHILVSIIGELMEMLRILLERVTDSDLQTLLLRVLDRGFEPIIPLLRTAISSQEPTDYAVQYQVLGFLNAFAVVDRCLPLQNTWSLVHAHDKKVLAINEDDEELEQRQSELLQRFLTFDEKNDVSTWEFLVSVAFSYSDALTVSTDHEEMPYPSVPTLLVFQQQYLSVQEDGKVLDPYYFQALQMALTLQRTLYASLTPDSNVEVDMSHAVASHVTGLNECCRRVDGISKSPTNMSLCRVIELHLDCLIALVNRRSTISSIQAAFDTNAVIAALVSHLPWSRAGVKDDEQPGMVSPLPDGQVLSTRTAQDSHAQELHHMSDPSTSSKSVPQLRLPLEKINRDGGSGRNQSTSIDTSDAVPPFKLSDLSSTSILVRESKLHALVVIFLVSSMLLEPSYELDDSLCSRYAPGVDQAEPGTISDAVQSDLLWQLQRHLRSAAQLDVKHFEQALFGSETTQAFATASRASAIRLVLRLLIPEVYDRTLYSLREQIHSARSTQEECEEGCDDAVRRAVKSPRQVYIAKGATATVYRSTSAALWPKYVAVKLVNCDQDGDRCIVGSVINEVSILKTLRGERAALQLVDFGYHHEEKSYEIVAEWCPSTLEEWRSAFACHSETLLQQAEKPNDPNESVPTVPFRACILMILRCFRNVCVCLSRIHARGVCHFDIKSANLFLRMSGSDFSRRLLLHGEKQGFDSEAVSLTGCVCFGDFGESMLAQQESVKLRSCSSFVSGAPTASAPVASTNKHKERENGDGRILLLSRTRGTEAIKSPEVFRIRGNEATKTEVTFASDVWSVGCLLYELVVQQLLFESDEWPALYAHLLASPDDSKVLREDHVKKMNAALGPSDESEQRVVDDVIALCTLILDRHPHRRPSLGSIVRHVTTVIQQVLKLPVTSAEKEFMKCVMLSKAQSMAASARCSAHDQATSTMAGLVSSRSMQSSLPSKSHQDERCDVLVSPRLFWNFFIARALPRHPRRYYDNSSVDLLACKEFEMAHEHEFVHFVYFSWTSDSEDHSLSPSSTSGRQANGDGGSSIVSRVYEDERRTVLHINPQVLCMYQAAVGHGSGRMGTQLAAQLLQGLVQQAPVLFPVLQRRLRREPGRVVFACMPSGSGAEEAKALEDVMLCTLLFFLERTVAVSPLDALATFARDCTPQFLAYPRRAFVHHLSVFASRQQQMRRQLEENGKKVASGGDEHKKRVHVCLCGASVLTLQLSALRHAMATQQCSCAATDGKCTYFHPFRSPSTASRHDVAADQVPSQDDDREDGDDHLLVETDDPWTFIPSAFVHDTWEEQLVMPMEVRARNHTPVDWVIVERKAVGRLASLLDCPPSWTDASVTGTVGASSSSSAFKRRPSAAFDALKRLVTRENDSPRPSPPHGSSHLPDTGDPLLLGLSPRTSFSGDRTRSSTWTLLECALCRLPMCAESPSQRGHLAVAVMPDMRDASTPFLL